MSNPHPRPRSSQRPRLLAVIAAALLLAPMAWACTGAGEATRGDATPDTAGADTAGADTAGADTASSTPGDQAPPSADPPPRPAGASLGATELGEDGEEVDEALEDYKKGDVQGAISTLKGLAGDPRVGFLAQYNLGVIADHQGQSDQAAGYFRECLRLNPDFSPALVNLVRQSLRAGKPDQALTTADTWVRQRPDNLRHKDARLQALLGLKRFEDVIREAREILRKDERNVRAMQNMALAYQALGKFELAQDILLQVVEINEDPAVEAEVNYRLGLVFLAQDKEPRARSAFEQAVQLRPDFAEARNDLGILYHKARDYQNAVNHFKAAIAAYPAFTEAMLNLGNAYKGLGDYTQAEDTFKRAILASPRYPAPYFNLGVLYLDANFEGRDKKQLFQLAIDNFNRYKAELKAGLSRDDPADKYIDEAKKKIELENKREQMRREQLKQAEEAPPAEEVDLGEDGGEEDK